MEDIITLPDGRRIRTLPSRAQMAAQRGLTLDTITSTDKVAEVRGLVSDGRELVVRVDWFYALGRYTHDDRVSRVFVDHPAECIRWVAVERIIESFFPDITREVK